MTWDVGGRKCLSRWTHGSFEELLVASCNEFEPLMLVWLASLLNRVLNAVVLLVQL